MPTGAGGFCRWLRSETAWTEARGRRSGAKIGGMDRQTLRDWVHRFNGSGSGGPHRQGDGGPKPRLSAEQRARFAQIVEAGPDREKNGPAAFAIRAPVQRVVSPGGSASVSATTRSAVSALSGLMREGRVLSRSSP